MPEEEEEEADPCEAEAEEWRVLLERDEVELQEPNEAVEPKALLRMGAEMEYSYGVVLALGLLPWVAALRVPEQEKIVAFAEMVEVKVVLLRKYCHWVREPAGQAEVVAWLSWFLPPDSAAETAE